MNLTKLEGDYENAEPDKETKYEPVYEDPPEPVVAPEPVAAPVAAPHGIETTRAAEMEPSYMNVDGSAYEEVQVKDHMYEGLDKDKVEIQTDGDKVYQGLH